MFGIGGGGKDVGELRQLQFDKSRLDVLAKQALPPSSAEVQKAVPADVEMTALAPPAAQSRLAAAREDTEALVVGPSSSMGI